MGINLFTPANILSRIVLTLPSKFNTDTTTNLMQFFAGISEALKLTTDMSDELFRQTNLISATGAYLDDYISSLSGLGRLDGESDQNYRTRHLNLLYSYNATKDGIKRVIFSLTNGGQPYGMYNGNKRGAYFDSSYFYNDTTFLSEYGDVGSEAFTGYIEFLRKPNSIIFDQLCKTISSCKAMGITIYLKYPLGTNNLIVVLTDGTLERTLIV